MSELDLYLEDLRNKREPRHPSLEIKDAMINEIIRIQTEIKPAYPSLHINSIEELTSYSVSQLNNYLHHVKRVQSNTEIVDSAATKSEEPKRSKGWFFGLLSMFAVLLLFI